MPQITAWFQFTPRLPHSYGESTSTMEHTMELTYAGLAAIGSRFQSDSGITGIFHAPKTVDGTREKVTGVWDKGEHQGCVDVSVK